MALLKNPSERKDWNAWAGDLRRLGHPVVFRRGDVFEEIPAPKISRIMKSLGAGETSQLVFIKGSCYLIRILDEKRISPRPLGEVSAQIRRSLAPVQLNKAVKEASERVMKTAKIVYSE